MLGVCIKTTVTTCRNFPNSHVAYPEKRGTARIELAALLSVVACTQTSASMQAAPWHGTTNLLTVATLREDPRLTEQPHKTSHHPHGGDTQM